MTNGKCKDCQKEITKQSKRCKSCSNKNRIVLKVNRPKGLKYITDQKGEKNPNWKGDKVGYASLHRWISRYKPKPEFCEDCKKVKPYDLANISQEYKRDINDFEWLCRRCHQIKDGRLEKFTEIGKLSYKEKRGL